MSISMTGLVTDHLPALHWAYNFHGLTYLYTQALPTASYWSDHFSVQSPIGQTLPVCQCHFGILHGPPDLQEQNIR